jgi:hypothetical protein
MKKVIEASRKSMADLEERRRRSSSSSSSPDSYE